jgi:hypothetical protein
MSETVASVPERQAGWTRRRAIIVLCVLVILNCLVLLIDAMKMLRGEPDGYPDIEQHFKYGSVGSDTLRQGLPYRIWKVLPVMFKDRLPQNGKDAYEAFGLIVERGQDGKATEDRPVGFSKRRIIGLDFVGPNCAFCHASTLRTSEGDPDPTIILGMPANSVDVEEFLVFLFKTAKDPKFTGDEVLREIEKQSSPMGFRERVAYRWLVVPLYRWEMGKLEQKFCFIRKLGAAGCATTKLADDAGPGRLDLWASYKVLRFATWNRLDDLLPDFTLPIFDFIDLDIGPAPGFADFAPLWQLEKRMGRGFHWDGNTFFMHDYAAIAALGFNVIPRSMDHPGFNSIALWAKKRVPPKYKDVAPKPFKVNAHREKQGEELYFRHCAACHDPGGQQFGKVTPIADIGTDRNRFDAFTEELANKLKRLGKDYDWKFHDLRKTRGYSNLPLDGIWLRAPYLHNGSVPTLRDLLAEGRPTAFCRGYDVYDWENVGFRGLSESACKARGFFWYATDAPGNGNHGHLYGTDLKDDEKQKLVEFLKTL